MDPLTLALLAGSFVFVLAVGVWLGAGSADMFEGLFGAKLGLDRPQGVQETDVPHFRVQPA
jgi:hypothetical protein